MKYQHMRPRVDEFVELSPDEVVARIKAHLARVEGCPYEGQMGGNHLSLRICEAQRAFWSPWLDCRVEAHERGAHIYGRLTPHPSVWTGFMAGYAFSAFIAIMGAVYGYTQLSMGWSPWGFTLLPIALLLALCLYLSSFLGQRLSVDQMVALRRFLDEALTHPVEG